MQSTIIDTLLLLGYEKYHKSTDAPGKPLTKGAKDTGDLKQLFIKPTEPVISSVVHFLLSRLDSRRANSAFRTLFPPKTPIQSRDFRQSAVMWLQELEGAGAFPVNSVSVSIFISPSPTKITRFLWALSSHVFREVAEREAGIKDHNRTKVSSSSCMAQAVARAELFTQRRHAAETKEREALKALSLLEKRLSELNKEKDTLMKSEANYFKTEELESESFESSNDVSSLRTSTDNLISLMSEQNDFEYDFDTQKNVDANSILSDFENKFDNLENDIGWKKLSDGISFRGGVEHLATRSIEHEALEYEKFCSVNEAAKTIEKDVGSLIRSTAELKARVEAKALDGPPAGQELPSNKATRELVLAAVDDVNIVVPGKVVGTTATGVPSTPSKRRKTVVVTPNTVAQNRKRAAKRVSLIVNKLQKKRNSTGFLLNLSDDEDEDEGDDGINNESSNFNNTKKNKGNL